MAITSGWLEERGADDLDPARVRVSSFRDDLVGHLRPVLLLIAAGAILVLLVASSNAANLLLARVASRQRELVVRRALGATRLRLARQVFSESLLLSVIAGAAAVPIAVWTLGAMRTFVPPELHGSGDIAINGRAIASLGSFSLLVIVLFGLLASLSARGRSASAALRATSVVTESAVWRRSRSALVVTEIAVALILLVGAVTIVSKVRELTSVDLGASGDRALVFEVTLPRATYDSADRVVSFWQRFEAELRAVPGIEEAGATNQLPGEPDEMIVVRPIRLEGDPPPPGERPRAFRLSATPGYFAAIGIDLLAGRPFNDADRGETLPVVIVSESFAEAAGMRAEEIVGRRMDKGGGREMWAEIVGVVRDIRLYGPEDDFHAAIYEPFAQEPSSRSIEHIVVKGAVDPPSLVTAIRRAASRVDPDLPLHNIRIFEEVRDAHLAERRFAMTTMLAFGGLAFALAAVGLYGVIRYLVQLRTREIGIRMAIGASPARVRREVLRSGVAHAVAGIVIGAAGALASWRVVSANVAGLGPIDPASLALLGAAILAVAVAATWLPAARATRVDPILALRAE